jgi:elongation factor Ts
MTKGVVGGINPSYYAFYKTIRGVICMASMKDIRELRERTGAGVLDCKNALIETDGDLESAVNYLRKKGIAAASERAGRIAAEGKINVLIDENMKTGIIVEVNSETDFVARNEKFQELVSIISQHLLESQTENVDNLLNETLAQDRDKNINTLIKEVIAIVGENINLRRFKRFTTTGFLQEYIHMGGKIGVLLDLDGEANENNLRMAHDVAMHIAASSPDYVNREQISDEVNAKERQIYKEQMLNEGKPEHIIDKIVDGKMEKFYSEVCLLEQPFVRDPDITVGKLLAKENLKVSQFIRYELGEGLEKRN